jgi:predicted dithiol-disulfide oxidoreductase (DUF899 family)
MMRCPRPRLRRARGNRAVVQPRRGPWGNRKYRPYESAVHRGRTPHSVPLTPQVAHPAHLNARDTTLVYVSRAPQAEIEGLKQRMGWELIPWYTLTDDFDKDFGVHEWHGHNAFIREGDRIFRTYFTDSRGDENLGTTWSYLDITALGRQEEWEDSPEGYPQTSPYQWWNYQDAYGKDA